jgi:hypothetical protein
MAHFHFHLWCGGQLTPDEAGAALPDLAAARHKAERIAASLNDLSEGAPPDVSGWDIEVTDDAGRTVLLVPVGDDGRELDRLERQAA